MLDESRVGTAMLTLQLRSAVQEAVRAEACFGDRDSARDELRGRLAVLVDRRRTDLASELAAEREVAARLIEVARQEAAMMVEASALVATSNTVPAAVVVSIVVSEAAAPGLNGRARSALLGLQLRAAMQEALDAERDEAALLEQWDSRLREARLWEQRRSELDKELMHARLEADAVVAGARAEAAALAAAVVPELAADDVQEPELPVVAAGIEPALEPDVEPSFELAFEPFVEPLVEPLDESVVVPVAMPAQPTQQLPVNVVIDAEAFARVFAAVFATIADERLAAWGPNVNAPMRYGTGPYPTQMYATLPQPAPVPVKQSFWSHAKHVDVLLLSAAMVIVLVVLAAWLV